MNENQTSNYFSVIKFCCISLLIVYFVSSSGKSLHAISVEWFLLAVILVASLGYELIDNVNSHKEFCLFFNHNKKNGFVSGVNRYKLCLLCVELLLTILLIVCFRESDIGFLVLPFAVMDMIVFFHLSFVLSLFLFCGVFVYPGNVLIFSINCIFIIIIYYQNYIIIKKYREYLEDFEKKEYQLKDSINSQDALYKEQLEKSSLTFENRMLEEKARLSQALHDKLGHSINGSVYQLEACKVLMEREPKESAKIIQAVIDNLRASMDEIRSILRREKPDKKRMAYLQLLQLCSDCKEKYGIQADVAIEGEDREIPELLWEVILDNTIEAVTNALKYSKCTKISIQIMILHKVVRCNIMDDGIGCTTLKEGMGIQGMKNRARKVNGYIDINSENGFQINMIIPLVK